MSVYCNNIIDYTHFLVTEAYFGKTPTILEIEKQIGVIRSSMKKYTDINRSPEVLKLNRLFEKQFGMDIFSLHIEQNNTINAYTIPVAKCFDIAFNEILSRKVVANQKDGYRFKEGNNLCIICNVYMGLLNCTDITDAEIVAVILHELGHNFADAIYKDIEIANKAQMKNIVSLLVYETILSLGLVAIPNLIYYKKNTNTYKKKQESKTKQRKIHGLLKGLKATCTDFNDYVNEIVNRIMIGTLSSNSSSKSDKPTSSKVKRSINRQNEVIADKFAAIYGYGPEQASALMKMEKQVSKAEKFVDKIPVIGKMANQSFNDIFKDIHKFDCHPHVIQRLNEEIKTLKAELEKCDLDPKLVKAMKNQIKQLEDLKNELTKITDNMTEEEQKRASYYASVENEEPDAIDQDLEEKITRAFDSLLEEN